MAPSALPDFVKQDFGLYKKKKQLSMLERDKNKKALIIKMISAIGLEKILKKKLELLKNVQNWNIEEKQKTKFYFRKESFLFLIFPKRTKRFGRRKFYCFKRNKAMKLL